MKRAYALLIFCCLFITTKAQLGKEAWNWQFGHGAALNFSSGSPVVSSSAIYTQEGSASISDVNTGQLLFYSDGITVWNKNNTQMPNGFGLTGNSSSTQSALIIPKPGSTTLYYIITADQEGGAGGVCYSVIDMTLNGGLGDIVSATKNTLLTAAPATEKILGVKHCNGQDYWIIDHNMNSNTFNAYLVTSAGISATPVISNVGTAPTGATEAIGYLKASPNGKKLAAGIEWVNYVMEIFDFDVSTGLITNPITIPLNQGSYGISFSPDNSKLYTDYADGYGDLYQFDLSSGVPATIIASKTIIASGSYFDALQLGPDGKIYMAVGGSSSLSVITNPNALGLACNFQQGVVALSPGSSSLGLPNFVDANSMSGIVNISNAVQCNSFTTDTLNAGAGFSSYLWSTGAVTQSITINSPGTYWVTVSNTNGCTITDTIKAYTINPNNIKVLKDTVVCSPTGNYTANATYNGATGYLWNDGTTNPIKTISTSGTYTVNIKFPGGCTVLDTFKVSLNTKPNVNIGNDTSICANSISPRTLNAGAGIGYTYNWSTGASTQTISINSGGTYWVNVTSAPGCSTTDSLKILQVTHHTYDTSLCTSTSFPLTLHAPYVPGNNNYYYWSGGYSNGNTDLIYYPGTYYLTLYVNGYSCYVTDTFNISIDTVHINDIVQCTSFNSYTVNAGTGFASYLWSNGATTYSTVINSVGTYWVKAISGGGCTAVDTFKASIINPANVHPIKDTTTCSPYYYNYFFANAYVNGAQSYVWSNGATGASQYIYGSGLYWVDIHFAGGCTVRDSFRLTQNIAPYVNLGYDQTYCNSIITPVVLDAGYGSGYTYQWSTGASTETISVTNAGEYTVTVNSGNGCFTKDSVHITVLNVPRGHSIDTSVCTNNSFPLQLNAPSTNGYNINYYYWSNGYYGGSTTVYYPGTYYLTMYVNNYSCYIQDTFNVFLNTVHVNDILACSPFTSYTVNAGSGYAGYLWSNGATTNTTVINSPGTYWIKVTSGGGCTAVDTFKASIINSSNVHPLKDTIICSPYYTSYYYANAYVAGAQTYTWSNGYLNPYQYLYGSGAYWVDIGFPGGCVIRDSFKLVQSVYPTVNLGPDQTFCNSITTPLVLDAGYGASYIYHWSNGSTTEAISVNNPGEYTVSVNSGGCITKDSIRINVIGAYAQHVFDTSICNYNHFPLQLNAPVINGNNNYYYWSNGYNGYYSNVYNTGQYYLSIYVNGGSCVINDTFNVSLDTTKPHIADIEHCYANFTPDIINAPIGYAHYAWSTGATTYSTSINMAGSYSLTVTSTHGCNFTDTFSVKSLNLPADYLLDTIVCGNSNLPINLNPPSIGSNFGVFHWSNGNTNTSISVNTPGNYFVNIYINGSSCIIKDTFKIAIDTAKLHMPDLNFCNTITKDTVYAASGYVNYLWSTASTTSSTAINGTGSYWLQVTNTKGCVLKDTFKVALDIVHKPTLPDVYNCNTSAPTLLNAGSSYTNYSWSTGSISQSITVTDTGKYWVTVTDTKGCNATDTVMVSYNKSPVINILRDTSVCDQASVSINATYPNTASYLWSDGYTQPVHTLNTDGTYWVVYTLNTTCTASDTFKVTIKNIKSLDSLANIVTPNNDNVNDFIDFGLYEFQSMQLTIYDRWGIKIFESSDPKCIWTPTCNDGTYFYVISCTTACSTNKETKTLKGFFTISK